METNECDSSRSTELDSSNQVDEFGAGVTCMKITMNVNSDSEISKPGPKAEVNVNDFDVSGNVKDSVIPCHHTTKSKQTSLREALTKVKIQRVILGVLLCTLTIAILVPTGFTVRTLLREGDGAEFEFPIYQNYCKINEPSTDIVNLIDLYDSCILYEGGICDPYLQRAGLTNVTTLHSVITSEQDLVTFFDVLDNNPNVVTKECNEAAKPLLCHYTYPFCSIDENYQFPSKEECVHVRDVSCATEWQIALAVMPDVLPRCELLDSMDEEFEIVNNTSSTSNEAPTCPKHFKLFCNETCLPLCESFSDHTESDTTSRILADISAAILAIIGGVLLITISVFRRDSMLKHPAIFVLYSSACPIVLGILLLITYIQRDLYCTSEILTEALSNPSPFCQLTGVLTHFTIVLNCNFWFLHVLHLYLNVLFPLKFSLLKDKRWEKRLHIIEVIASIGFAGLGPAVVWLSNNDYNTFTRPPLLCIPTPNSMLLYTLCLPVLFLLIIGVNLIATVVWALLKRNFYFKKGSTKRQRRHNCTMATMTPEVKMLILLCYFVVYIAVLSALIVVTVEYSEPITEGIFGYFLCQLSGENPNCDVLLMQFRQYLRPKLASATFLMTGLINWIYLIFPIHYKDIEYIVLKVTARINRVYKTSIKSSVTSRNDSSV